MPNHKWLDTGFSSQAFGLNPWQFHMEDATLEQFLWFSLLFGLIFIPAVLAVVLTMPHVIAFSVFNLGPSCLPQNFDSYRAINLLLSLKRS